MFYFAVVISLSPFNPLISVLFPPFYRHSAVLQTSVALLRRAVRRERKYNVCQSVNAIKA